MSAFKRRLVMAGSLVVVAVVVILLLALPGASGALKGAIAMFLAGLAIVGVIVGVLVQWFRKEIADVNTPSELQHRPTGRKLEQDGPTGEFDLERDDADES